MRTTQSPAAKAASARLTMSAAVSTPQEMLSISCLGFSPSSQYACQVTLVSSHLDYEAVWLPFCLFYITYTGTALGVSLPALIYTGRSFSLSLSAAPGLVYVVISPTSPG